MTDKKLSIEQLKLLSPVIRLVSGIEMAGYRQKMFDILEIDANLEWEESRDFAHECDTALDIFCLYFPEDIQ